MIDTNNIGPILQILQIVVILGGGFAGLIVMRGSVQTLKSDMTDMKAEIKKVGEVLVTLAVTSKRLDNVEEDIRDLKHGRGFIQNRSGSNGEYP